MHQDERRGVEFEGAFHDLSRIDRDVVDGAAGLLLVRDQCVFGVQIQNAKLFGVAVCHHGVAIIEQGVPTGDDLPCHDFAAGHAMCSGLYDLEFKNDDIADALDFVQGRGGGGQDAVEVAEMVDQGPRKGFDILPWNGTEQDKFE